MKPLYTQTEFNSAKSTDKLSCECYQCGNIFYSPKKEIKYTLKNNLERIKYCSIECRNSAQLKNIILDCKNCGETFNKKYREYKRDPDKNHFCSRSCAASYNNKHKKHGTRRSKLEGWIEEQLTILYPNLDIHFNRKDIICSELDIYIPSLNLAFELNGIFHYEPIYGKDKLKQIQENDYSKTKACHDNQIDLCIIDTSTQKRFTPKSSEKYLNIITNIIKERLLTT